MESMNFPEELKEFTLKESLFFNDSISMHIPDYMKDMPTEDYQRRFPGQIKTEVAMTSPQGNAILVFQEQVLDNPIISIDIFIEQESIKMERVIPGYAEMGRGTKVINGLNVGCIQYKSNAIDKDLINTFFAFRMGNTLRYGLFIAPFEWCEAWTKIFLTCIETLRVEKC